jgi:hypothetical protein
MPACLKQLTLAGSSAFLRAVVRARRRTTARCDPMHGCRYARGLDATLPDRGLWSMLQRITITMDASGSDCNDDDPTVWQDLPYAFRDADVEGHTVAAAGPLCSGFPPATRWRMRTPAPICARTPVNSECVVGRESKDPPSRCTTRILPRGGKQQLRYSRCPTPPEDGPASRHNPLARAWRAIDTSIGHSRCPDLDQRDDLGAPPLQAEDRARRRRAVEVSATVRLEHACIAGLDVVTRERRFTRERGFTCER